MNKSIIAIVSALCFSISFNAFADDDSVECKKEVMENNEEVIVCNQKDITPNGKKESVFRGGRKEKLNDQYDLPRPEGSLFEKHRND